LTVGEGHRIYASGLDVTDVRELERRTRLAEKLAAVGTVSAGLAHEIRNPLNAAGLQLQLLERRIARVADQVAESAKLHEPIDLVRSEIDRLSRLVSEFLLFARPTALAARDSDLSSLMAEVVGLEQPVAAERGIALELRVPDAPVVLEIDRERIKQVALNLVRNAIEAAPDDGHVQVAVERDGAGARFAVRDDGAGIPAETIGRIFEPFFTTKDGGTGLGMAIAHSLVDLHGGGIEVRTGAEGAVPVLRGAEFVVTLPRRPPKLA
jgi:signal transduction histidine kinase